MQTTQKIPILRIKVNLLLEHKFTKLIFQMTSRGQNLNTSINCHH